MRSSLQDGTLCGCGPLALRQDVRPACQPLLLRGPFGLRLLCRSMRRSSDLCPLGRQLNMGSSARPLPQSICYRSIMLVRRRRPENDGSGQRCLAEDAPPQVEIRDAGVRVDVRVVGSIDVPRSTFEDGVLDEHTIHASSHTPAHASEKVAGLGGLCSLPCIQTAVKVMSSQQMPFDLLPLLTDLLCQ
jgi:hypothetical protein